MAKAYRWNDEKDEWLRQTRGFGFQDIVEAVDSGRLVKDIDNPSERYPNQKLLVVEVDGYVIGVPYLLEGETAFLKTAFPSRKLKRLYMGN